MRESINHLRRKIKSVGEYIQKDDVFIVLLLILTNFASFGLGRLSKIDEQKTPLQLNQENTAVVDQSALSDDSEIKGKYVASKTGTKYHLPWCPGAQTIKEENKIWFNSKEEAEKAGYGPAGNCKGI